MSKAPRAFLLLASLWISVATGALAQPVLLRFGRALSPEGDLVEGVTITVEGDRIVRIEQGWTPAPAGAREVDLRAYTAVPGLIDAHAHLSYAWDEHAGGTPWQQLAERPRSVAVPLAERNAALALRAGITTLRDLNALDSTSIILRDRIRLGEVSGPRMLVAGYGLHRNRNGPPEGYIPPSGGAGHGDEIKEAVERQLRAGADFVKLYASTGGPTAPDADPTFTEEEIALAVAVARKHGALVAVHTYAPQAVGPAARAGAVSIEHAVGMDEEALHEMARNGTYYVPTLSHYAYYVEAASLYGFDEADRAALAKYIERRYR